MMPLNYAILDYFTHTDRACADEIIAALAPRYGKMRGLRKAAVIDALMTAEKNGLIEEDGCDLDDGDDLRVYYKASEEGRATIRKYVG
ncbi:MAG: hypothetical protein Q4C56_07315 [Peptococcaceae bacterium]|nr:hypothetical protein [Peptococcaceae bacterium]